jgi:hypothetical protein
MTEEKEHLQAITDIRSMMERSSRCISLSGLSGVFSGIFALIGAYLAIDRFETASENCRSGVGFFFIGRNPFNDKEFQT